MRTTLLLLTFVTFFSNAQEDASALNFDGVDDYVNIGTDNTFNYSTTSSFTIEAWIKPSSTDNSWKVIAARESWNDGQGWIFHAFNNRLYFRTPNATVFSNELLTNDEWTHIAVTFSTTSVSIYQDGVNIASGNLSIVFDSGQSMYIGARHFNSGNGSRDYFDGDIDDLRFWSTSRTPMEIRQNRECALAGTESGLVSYYKFNQGLDNEDNSSEATLISSNTSFNGTLNNFSLTGAKSNYFDGSDNGVDQCETLSIETNILDNSISLFPNPASNKFTIQKSNSIDLVNATITDVNGRMISKIDLEGMQSSKSVVINNLKSGLYLVKIQSKNASITKKLIVR